MSAATKIPRLTAADIRAWKIFIQTWAPKLNKRMIEFAVAERKMREKLIEKAMKRRSA